IGKVPSAHLRLDDETVSRMHAIIEITGGEVSLIDLGSMRGTYVNGRKIHKARLQSGDVLLLGDTRVELAISEVTDVERASPTPGHIVGSASRTAELGSAAAPPSRPVTPAGMAAARPPITAAAVSAVAGELVIPDASRAQRSSPAQTGAPPPRPAHVVAASVLDAAGGL